MSDITARNLNGDEFVVNAQTELNHELNGNITLKLTISPNQVNNIYINEIDTMWEIDYYGNTFKIVYRKKHTKGTRFYIDVRAVHLALDRLDSIRTYERYDKYMGDDEGFSIVFSGTGYSYVLLDSFSSIEVEGLGDGETKLETLKRLLERFKAEFYIEGSTFYIAKLVGRDTNFEYRYKLNASNVRDEKEGASTFTYVRGFGDYDEGEENILKNAGIKMSYESPLSKIIGRRHGPMVAKGSYKNENTVQNAMEDIVDNSVVLSISAEVKDLRKQGYPFAQPEVGDRVFLNDSRINYNREVRVVQITTQRFSNGNIKNINVTFGNQKISRRYASNLSSAMANLEALLKGDIQIPFATIDQLSKDMLRKIMSVDTELTLDNGIYAIDKDNPNNVVGLNSAGWFISNDGGTTANVIATADGVVADAITSGTLNTNLITLTGGDSSKYISIENDEMSLFGTYSRTWQGKTTTNNVFTRFKDGHLRFRNNDYDRSIYMSDFGLSSYLDGNSREASGTLEFFDYTYDSNARGITLQSGLGVVALRSDANRMVLEADDTVNIGSNKYSIYMRPFSSTRMGVNEFQFYVKDNPDAIATDGAILYGNLTGSGKRMGSGLRFSKELPVVYATNDVGDMGSGYFYGAGFQGDWLAKNTNVYACVEGALRVTDLNGYNNGYPTYKPVQASGFNNKSLEEYKEKINYWEDDALSIISKETDLYTFKYKNSDSAKKHYGLVIGDNYKTSENFIDGDSVNLYDMITHSFRAIQQLNEKIDYLEGN